MNQRIKQRMKRLPFLVLLVIGLFIMAGCGLTTEDKEQSPGQSAPAPEPVAPVEPELNAPSAPAAVPVPEPELPEPELLPVPAPEKVASEPEEQEPSYPSSASGYADQRVADLFERHKKTESYSFYYATSELWNLLRDQYFIKGSRIKIKLYEPNQWNRRSYFDTVYLDTTAKTAEAYCESRERERCTDNTKKSDVLYDDYTIRTPTDWLLSIPSNAQVIGGEQVEDRAAIVVDYPRADGATVRISVDKFSGTPIMVQVYQGDVENLIERYLFKEISVNSVKTSEMFHKT